MEKKDLLKDVVEHIDIKKYDSTELINAMRKMSFTSRDTARAADINFADDFIYKELEQHYGERTVPFIPLLRDEAIETFRAWEEKQDKVEY